MSLKAVPRTTPDNSPKRARNVSGRSRGPGASFNLEAVKDQVKQAISSRTGR